MYKPQSLTLIILWDNEMVTAPVNHIYMSHVIVPSAAITKPNDADAIIASITVHWLQA